VTAVLTDPPEAPAAPPVVPKRRRVRTPSLRQMEAVECGAAALRMILAYYGRWVSLEELRAACGVSRDGSRAANVVKAARLYGLSAKGVRVELADLATLALPVIAFWNMNHFVVVDGVGPAGLHLEDPAVGSRQVDWTEADGAFSGIVLCFDRGADFEPGGAAPSAMRGLARRLTTGRSALVLCLLAGLGLLVPGLLVPAAIRIFVNEYLGAGVGSWLWVLVVGLGLATVVQVSLTWLQQTVLLRLSTKLSVSMSARFFEHVLSLPSRFFSQRFAGQIVNRIAYNDQIAALLSSQASATALAALTAIFYVVLMVIYDWQLTVLSLALSAINVAVFVVGARRQREATESIALEQSQVTATAVGALANIESIKSTSEDGSVFARWAGQQAKLTRAQQDLAPTGALMATAPVLLSSLSTSGVIGFGAYEVLHGSLSLGTVTAFLALLGGFTAPLAQLVGFGQTIDTAAANLISIDDVLAHPSDPDLLPESHLAVTADGPATTAMSRGTLELVSVTFGYVPLDPPLLDGMCLQVTSGRRVAIVGPTGSGKSTVSRLAVGLEKPWSGQVLLDGVDRRELPAAVCAASIAFVDQDIRLFEGAVRDNLTLWDPTITEEAMIRAAKDALIHDDILRRPGGYDQAILEGGADWSGGQRQRLEIARALAGEPSILVLDEATSALDPLVELGIDQNLRARGCTCLIVAHRLSTIRDCDEIVVLDTGRVAERGRHEELLALEGTYASLVAE
jgi:NHLM bacteriocin system ABC transporter peptidase/ATP-binding protein